MIVLFSQSQEEDKHNLIYYKKESFVKEAGIIEISIMPVSFTVILPRIKSNAITVNDADLKAFVELLFQKVNMFLK